MDNEGEQTLGAVLMAARKRHGLERRQLANIMGTVPSQITRWERDTFVPSPSALVQLARHLELRASDLFLLAGVPIPSDVATIPAMLRSRYGLPREAIEEIQQHIVEVAEKYNKQYRGIEQIRRGEDYVNE